VIGSRPRSGTGSPLHGLVLARHAKPDVVGRAKVCRSRTRVPIPIHAEAPVRQWEWFASVRRSCPSGARFLSNATEYLPGCTWYRLGTMLVGMSERVISGGKKNRRRKNVPDRHFASPLSGRRERARGESQVDPARAFVVHCSDVSNVG